MGTVGHRHGTTLTETNVPLHVVELGPDNPLPVVSAVDAGPYTIGDGVPADLREATLYGRVPNIFPYQYQDGYTRQRMLRDIPAVVLENSRLRAVFLPTLGGRLWELLDKASGKQLVHTQPDVQFANIALRKAWFAGGLEWNIGTRGHSPTTCSPLHTATLTGPGGVPLLRMWEFERLRSVVFQVDAWLPEDSPVLFVAVRIRNPNDRDVPMYWWSNAAVPETARTRVIAPAWEAFGSDYATDVARMTPTEHEGVDATWPVRNTHAADYFFDLAVHPNTDTVAGASEGASKPADSAGPGPGPDARSGRRTGRPWILAADADGDGLAILSTPRLRGRKLFVWGQGDGGRRWQEWLSPSGGRYAEIQAGLARTQYEHVRLPASSEWTWVEAYGNPALDPELAHSPDWAAAVGHAEDRMDRLLSQDGLASALHQASATFDDPPERLLLPGSGWGALEAASRQQAGLRWINEAGTPFGEHTLGSEQRPWLELLRAPRSFVGADTFVAGPEWEERLAAADGPDALFQLATMRHARQDLGAAVNLYRRTLYSALDAVDHGGPTGAAASGSAPVPGEHRIALVRRGLGLALLATAHTPAEATTAAATAKGTTTAAANTEAGLAELAAACRLEPGSVPLLREAMSVLLDQGNPLDAVALADQKIAGPAAAADGRVRFLVARALSRCGRGEEAAAMLKEGIEVPDLLEGEDAVSELWQEVCPGEPVPPHYRFSMHQ